MDVIQRRQSRGQGEAALEGPLRQPADAHHGAHRRLFLVMLRGPLLAASDHRISQLAGAHHRGVGQRAGHVPVEQVQPRHLHRLARTDETGDEKQPQRMPAAATARHHQALADAGADQCLVRMPAHVRVFATQAIAVAPVRSPFAAGQEPGTRQQHRPGASRRQRRAGRIALAQPLRLGRVAIIERLPGADRQVADDHHVGRRCVVQTGIRVDRDIVVDPQRVSVAADDQRQERRRHVGAVQQLLPVATGTQQQIVEAEQRRGRTVRRRQQGDGQRRAFGDL